MYYTLYIYAKLLLFFSYSSPCTFISRGILSCYLPFLSFFSFVPPQCPEAFPRIPPRLRGVGIYRPGIRRGGERILSVAVGLS